MKRRDFLQAGIATVALGAATGFELSQDRLKITDDAGRCLLTFAKA